MKLFLDKRIFLLVCINAALYVFIVILDVMNAFDSITPSMGHFCDAMKYAAIISCLLICVFAYSRSRERTPLIQMIVFSVTLGADFFLLFTPYFVAGVFVFIAAHTCALIRYKPRWSPFVGAASASVFILALYLAPRILHSNSEITLFIAVTGAYAVLIISVAISTFFAPQPRVNTLFSRFGMCLFIACDINVLIFNAIPAGATPHTASIFLMWLFYLPAQTLLALSACKWQTKADTEASNLGGQADQYS